MLSSFYRIVILFLIMISIGFVCLNPLKKFQYGVTSDEGYYYKYAVLICEKGTAAFNELISWYGSSEEARKHPAPVRVGYMLLSAALFKLLGPSFSVLGLISTISFLIFLYICFYYFRKYFNLDTALLVLLFLSSSPLVLGLSRRALTDSSSNMFWALVLWLFLDVLMRPKKFSYVIFIITLSLSILFRESSLILIPFFFCMALLWRHKNPQGMGILKTIGIVIYPVLISCLVYVWVCGGVENLRIAFLSISKTHFSSSYSNPYAIYYSSGPWFRYILDFLLLSPIITILSIGWMGHMMVQRNLFDFKNLYLFLYFVYVYGVLSAMPHSKVVRYVVNLEMIMALYAVLMLMELLKLLPGQKKHAWFMSAAVVIFFYNFSSFLTLFYQASLLDPISYHLLVLRHLIPS